MRKIKFRLWDKTHSEMWPQPAIDLNNILDACKGETDVYHLMQFTGLLDKNGVEIYEGDILKWKWVDDNIGEVVWDELNNDGWVIRRPRYTDKSDFAGRDDGMVYMEYNPGADNEVIGNIYENPELI